MLNLLKFDILGNNRSGPAFDKMRNDLKGVRGALAGVNDYARRTGRAMRNIGAGMSAGVTAPLTLLGKQSLQLYQTQAEAEAKVAQAIRSTGGAAGYTEDQLKGMAGALQNVTTFGDEDILANVTAPLLTFTKVQGEVFDRAQANVLDMATLLKMDLKSASVLVGKALNDPVKGISALSRSGVQFSDSQKEVIKQLVTTGDVAGAQALILKELETQFKGQAAAIAQTPMGKWEQLSNAIGDIKEELGAEIVPFLDPLADQVKKAVAAFAGLSPETKRNIVVFGGLAAAIGPVVAVLGVAAMGVGTLATAIGGLGAALTANPIGLAIAVIAGGAYLIYRNWEGISAWFAGKWAAVRATLTGAWEAIKSVFLRYTPLGLIYSHWEGITGWFAQKWGAIKSGVTEHWDRIRQTFSGYSAATILHSLWHNVGTWFTTQWNAVLGSITLKWEQIKTLLQTTYGVDALIKDAWSGIGAWFSSLSGEVTDAFVTIWEAIKTEVSAWPGRMVQYGKDIVSGLVSGILGDSEKAASAGRNLGRRAARGTREAVDSHSPSRVFMGIGSDIVDGLALGIEHSGDKATAAVRGVAGAMVSVGEQASQKFAPVFSGAFKSILDGTKSAKQALGDLAKQLVGMALDANIKRLFDMIFSGGSRGGSGGLGGVVASFFGFAKGGAFAGGRQITAFAKGGVVGNPTAFGMARNQLGVMGERGPEAILPLKRGPGGVLGVRAVETRRPAAEARPGRIRVDLGEHLVGTILQTSARQSVQITGVAAQQQQATMGANLSEQQLRGTS
ncbi:hypothetical protein [Marinovum sp.]|uniref:hypothetical protein n=1 Tax=Marinovum sp. TaxID=2024839 RepID=UPI002B27505E|nr:hypothetical protein [Marinovum sp.]